MNNFARFTIIAALFTATSLLGCSAGLKLGGGSDSQAAPAAQPARSSPGRVGASSTSMASMPDVRGLTAAEATTRLRAAGFTGTVRERSMSRGMCPKRGVYAPGQVCSTFPPAGRRQAASLTVTYTLAE